MTTRTLLPWVAAVALISSAAADEPQEAGRLESLERPPALSKGARAETGSRESNAPLERPPALSGDTENDADLEPSITIREQGEVTVYEYRLNGLLYGIKVVPKNAPAYYLVDTDGDGFMDWRRNDLTSPEMNRVPAWVLFRW